MGTLLKSIEDIKLYVSINAASNIGTFNPSIDEAQINYIIPEIGEAFFDELLLQYTNNNLSPENANALPYVQRSLANYMMYLWADVGNLSLSDMGIQQSMSERTVPAQQRPVENLKRKSINSGDIAMEKLLKFLEDKENDYPTWKGSTAYTKGRELFIKTAEELTNYLAVNNSRRLYRKLIPYLRRAEEMWLKKILCTEQYDDLKTQDKTNSYTPEGLKLLPECKPVVAYRALQKALPEIRISITHDGLSVSSYTDGLNKRDAATDTQKKELAKSITDSAKDYTDNLTLFLEENIDDYPLYSGSTCYAAKADPGPTHQVDNSSSNNWMAP